MGSEPVESAAVRRPGQGGRREQILAAALRLFSEHGVHTVTTRQIAALVGISQPSLYAHFPTKHALASEVCVRAFDDLAARMTQARDALVRGQGSIADVARVYVDFGLTQPDAYRLAFMVEQPDLSKAEEGDPILKAGLRAFSIHREAVALSLGRGLSEGDLDLLAQSLWASLHGLVSLLIARPGFPWADRERLIDAHIRREFAPRSGLKGA